MDVTLKSTSLSTQLNRCKLIKPLGHGGQKKVYLVELGKIGSVALKVGTYRSPNSLERIKREVELLSNSKIAGIAEVLEFHNDPSTREFVIIEKFYEGQTLDECSLLFRNNPNQALQLLKNCFEILSSVWRNNIVHRDLKPQNIILGSDFKPTILDFGIARFLDQSSLTGSHAGQGPCTPIYAPREQLTNRKVKIDQRSDFFSLGVMVSELVTGLHPFSPEAVEGNKDIVENILDGTHSIADGPFSNHKGLLSFLERSIQKEPHMRHRNFASALNMLNEISL